MVFFSIQKAVIMQAVASPVSSGPEKIEFSAVTDLNINDAAWFNSQGELDSFREFLKRGYFGYFGYLEGKCVFRSWLFTDSEKTFTGEHFLYKLAPDEFFSAWNETAPEYRGRGIYPAAISFLRERYPANPITAYVEANNFSSIKGLQKAGLAITRKFLLIKVWKFKIAIEHFRYTSSRYFSLRFGHLISSLNIDEKA